jgi:hypothetical protein
MRSMFKRTNEAAVTVCERRGEACDPGCRRAALRERALWQQLRVGVRV